MGQNERLHAGTRPIPRARPGQGTVVAITLGARPLPAEAGPGHDGTEQGSLPVTKPGISSRNV